MSRIYYQLVMFPQSPLRIGGGNTEDSIRMAFNRCMEK